MDGPVGGRVSVQPGDCVDGPFGGRVSVQPWRLSGWPIWWPSVCPAFVAEWMAHLVAKCLSSLGGWVNGPCGG